MRYLSIFAIDHTFHALQYLTIRTYFSGYDQKFQSNIAPLRSILNSHIEIVLFHVLTIRISRQKSPCFGPDFICVFDDTTPDPLKMAIGEKN
jgi:hypothetical protein